MYLCGLIPPAPVDRGYKGFFVVLAASGVGIGLLAALCGRYGRGCLRP